MVTDWELSKQLVLGHENKNHQYKFQSVVENGEIFWNFDIQLEQRIQA